jgi:hypothetical protein
VKLASDTDFAMYTILSLRFLTLYATPDLYYCLPYAPRLN